MSGFSHIVLNVADLEKSCAFYLEALAPLKFVRADSEPREFIRLTNGRDAVIVLSAVEDRFKDWKYHRKGVGLGHLALAVDSKDVLDQMENHIRRTGISILGEGRIWMGYRRGYDSFFFEDPDRILIEIVCHDSFYFSAAVE